MTNWDHYTGVICQGYGEDVFRILEDVCVRCHQKQEARAEAEIEMAAAL